MNDITIQIKDDDVNSISTDNESYTGSFGKPNVYNRRPLKRMQSFVGDEDITKTFNQENVANYVINNENIDSDDELNQNINENDKKDMDGMYLSANEKVKFVTFEDVSKILSTNYTYEESIQSTTIDIISLYLKGQKILYTEAKVHCEIKLYFLMLPAIFISALCTVLSLALTNISYGSLIVSIFTASNTFILGLVSYLKLDAKAEAHKSSAASFDKLQSMCEFYSGRILFGKKANDKTPVDFLNELELKVREIKEKNTFILPEIIRFRFSKLYLTNIFAEVKRIQNQEIILINDFKISLNEIITLEKVLDLSIDNDKIKLTKNVLRKKHNEKNEKLKKILEFKNSYIDIDNNFKKEIEDNIKFQQNKRCKCGQWLKT